MKPLISVVMPTYNSEKYVAEAAESILKQTLGDFEFLIVNEYGSNDATVDIINAFHDPRVRIVQNTERLGIAASLNEGVRQAKGKYIARMDSDDISVPERFEKQVAFMEANPDIAVCGGWVWHIGLKKGLNKMKESHEELKTYLLFSCELFHPVIMMRREAILNNNLWYDPAYIAEDFELFARAIHQVKFANIQELLAYYRTTENKLTFQTKIKQTKRLLDQDAEICGSQLKRLGIDYKNDYPPYLAGGWFGCLYRVPRRQWKERLAMSKELLLTIWKQNEKLGLYNKKMLAHCLSRQYIRNYDLDDMLPGASKVFPFEHLADDIIDDLAIRAGERVCLYGQGKIGSKMLPHFKRRLGASLVCVSDSNPAKWGERFGGLECVPPDELERDLCVIITTAYEMGLEIRAALEQRGFARVLPFASLFSEPI